MTSEVHRKKMEEKADKKPPPINVNRHLKISDLNMDERWRKSPIGSPVVLVSPSTSKTVTLKSSSERWNCLCSPTTHAGSFRCRHHRSHALHRAKSVGSNLSAFTSKDSFSFHPQ